VGSRYCISVTSGTTALHLALMGLGIGPGDEVITVANTCAPTIAAIELAGARPVFVDVRDDDLMIDMELVEAAITPRTKCLMPVHLWGQGVDIERVIDIAGRHGLIVVEDCAQAQGTRFGQRHAGTFGVAGCFSFYPTKNLGAYGDGGAIVTDDEQLAARLRRMRMYGYDRPNHSIEKGMNGRIAELQAAILRVKLKYLGQWVERRRAIAARYQREIRHPRITLPLIYPDRAHPYHQYVIRCQDRAAVIAALEANGIGYGIHYPIPVHLMPAYENLGRPSLPVTERACDEILSLPVHEALTDQDIETVIRTLNGIP
jgi:aminotransferase EvaB